MIAQAVGQQPQADHQQKAQTEHDDRGMALHKAEQRRGGQSHDQHGRDHGQHHHRDMVHHPHGGDDGIQRKDGVQGDDLRDHPPEARVTPRVRGTGHLAFQAFVQLQRALEKQEQAAAYQNQIPRGKGAPSQGEQGRGEPDDPTRMEMNTRLSTPSTTSSSTSVPRPAQAESSVIHEKSHISFPLFIAGRKGPGK